MIPYENFINTTSESAYRTAQKIVSSGWSLRTYPTVRLDAIPWTMESPAQRSWNFHMHSWDMLEAILRAYSDFGEKALLEISLSVALEWAGLFGTRAPSSGKSMAWYDMAVGLRAYRLAYMIDAADVEGMLDDDARRLLWCCLVEHQAYLGDDANFCFHNNHGYYQAAGQLAMGRRFAHVDSSMEEAYQQGKLRLARMLDQQFADDGVHKEHSPDYHRMVCGTLKSLVDSGLIEEDLSAFYDRIESSLAWFILPSGHMVNFGDTDYRSILSKPDTVELVWKSPEMRYFASSGAKGSRPVGVMKAFEKGGYFVVRKHHENLPLSSDSYLAQIACFHSRTHKHADDLSFIWSDRGTDLLVDAGRYGYIGKTEQSSILWKDGFWYADPNRVYCESTHAHNTLEFDNRSYLRRGVDPYGVALGRRMEHESGIYIMETECRQFDSIRHARVLVLSPGNWLIVFDWFKDNLHDPHDVRQWFHFAPGLQLQREKGGYRAIVPGGDLLRVEPCFPECVGSEIFWGEEEPRKQGWWSPADKTMVENSAVCFELQGRKQGAFATLFSFSDELAVDRDRSSASISGKTFSIAWSDGAANFQLRVERPAVGDLEVEYRYTRQASIS